METCVTGTADAGTVRLQTPAEQQRKARIYERHAEHRRSAVDDHLRGTATLQAINQGYYAMFHEANQAMARAGFDSNSHRCTLLGLRGLYDAPELARELQRAMDERRNVDYRIDPGDPAFEEFASIDQFISETVDPFLDAVNRLISDIEQE